MRPQSLAGIVKQNRKIIFVAGQIYSAFDAYRPAFVIPYNEMCHGTLWSLSSHDNSDNPHNLPHFN